ncbi:bifunctional hydroxymethylpyrimidine kinase/phosphomethylpyrimidine kinase [Paeniglutamicibacter sp. ABSL32-1]|uniref:bifunctional hydroxymethylpyrimidine kinase/phosphomethylpyrimidine kinase n=1 Tax=Paeniglutamicibacter quisquiliarum TaxID=2849498 RepID=UPI001C2CCEAD|nr:bifunctional hydroxymethylpyrimidine kinase/phosphomethylpyrimidine kinase [Paeniglutamicibacter quisquiliarum]MBV1781150.1 bifunctional hydroxymethylpyrimidine kinase/phosphomethylpyrimidine kinase [Paeniglutamicibacter quisquiliarum]
MSTPNTVKNILSIAGSDPSGGAGIQADLKSIAAAGGYGMAAISALTAQNTRGVSAVHVPPAGFLLAQLRAISEDISIDAIKIGMLANARVIDELGGWLAGIRADGSAAPAVVLDPVMVATSGDSLLDADAEAALRRLLAHVDVLTPNIPELAVLARGPVATDWEQAVAQARGLAAEYRLLVLAKGGHQEGDTCRDAIIGPDGVLCEVASARLATANTHGTGCSLSSALATFYARGSDWGSALRHAKAWLFDAISRADELAVGSGHGPVNHLAGLWDGVPPAQAQDPLARWWEEISGIRAGIDELAFIRRLKDGTLETADFEDYLGQDALYLRAYARVMSRASELAPTTGEQRFWATSAAGCLEEELALHRGRLAEEVPEPSDATTAYLNHLLSGANDYPVLAAALLPCFWIYQDVGSRLAASGHPAHPYADWLAAYSSAQFDEATARAIELVRSVHARADGATRERMWRAFEASSVHELAFFAQTSADAPGAAHGAGPAAPAVALPVG